MILFGARMLSGMAIAYAAFRYWKRVLKTRPLSLMALFIPPDDFYENLFEVKLPSIGDQASFEIVYSHRYAGTHDIGLVCEKRIDNPIKIPILRVRVRARWKWPDGKFIAEKVEMISLNRPWWAGPEKNGFILFYYELSESMPVGKRVSLEITIDNCNEVVENYGVLSVYGGKVSVE